MDAEVKDQDVEVIEDVTTKDEPISEPDERISLTEEQGEEILREYFDGVKAGVPRDVLDNMTPSILKKDEDNVFPKEAPESKTKTEGADKGNPPADDDISKLTPEQLAKNYRELQKKLGEQGSELGELRKLKATMGNQGYNYNNNPTGQVNPIAHNIFSVNQPLPQPPQQIPVEQAFDFTNPESVKQVAIKGILDIIRQNQMKQNQAKMMTQMQGFQSAFEKDIQELVDQGVSPEEAQKIYAEHFNEFVSNPVKTAYQRKLHQQEILEAEKRGEQKAIEKMQNATNVNPKRVANITSATTKQGNTDYKNMSPAELQTYIGTLDVGSKQYDEVTKFVISMAAKER